MSVSATIGTPASGGQAARAIYLGTPGHGNQAVIAGWVGTSASGNQQFFAALSASIAPNPATASRSTAGPLTTSAMATPTGGVGPYSYAWAQQSGDAMTLTGASSSSAGFSANVGAAKPALTAVFQCVVTDTATGATATPQVTVQLFYTGNA